jgi:hypothetical protein
VRVLEAFGRGLISGVFVVLLVAELVRLFI